MPDSYRLNALIYGRVPRTIDVAFGFYRRPPFRSTLPTYEVMHDVQLFFDILREVYGAYTFFGGDEVFLPIFEEILNQLEAFEFPHTTQSVARTIHARLNPYIHDNHLSLAHHDFTSSYCVFVGNMYFERTVNGFKDRNSGLYVQEIVGHNKIDILRLSINQYAEFLYTPVIVGNLNSVENYLTIVFENGESTTVGLYSTKDTSEPYYRRPSLDFVDGFPIVTINAMYFEHIPPDFEEIFFGHIEGSYEFHSFVDKLQNEPAIIIDLRENFGGNALLARRWLYNLVGEFVPTSGIMLVAEDYEYFISWRIEEANPDNPFYQPMCEIRQQEVHLPLGDYHTVIYPTCPSRTNAVVPNDQIIIFLTSRRTASAAEDFIDMAFHMENTLVIGQNTAGTFLTNLCFPWRALPYTGIRFGLGAMVQIHADAHNFQEGIGLTPDLWVPCNDDALLAALALLRNHFASNE